MDEVGFFSGERDAKTDIQKDIQRGESNWDFQMQLSIEKYMVWNPEEGIPHGKIHKLYFQCTSEKLISWVRQKNEVVTR